VVGVPRLWEVLPRRAGSAVVTHASVELLEAIRGVAPWADGDGIGATPADWRNACDGEFDREEYRFTMAVLATTGWASDRCAGARIDDDAIDCPACLLLMREATHPVRWDELCERGEGRLLEGK
jgi:hypothetical protein